MDTPRSQALIGFVQSHTAELRHLAVAVTNQFCGITLSALDDEPIGRSVRLLLTTGARGEYRAALERAPDGGA